MLNSIFILFSCKTEYASDDEVVIKGRFIFSRGEKLYLEQVFTDNKIIIDSTVVNENGEFNFKVKPQESTFFIVKTAPHNTIMLLGEHGETIELSGDMRDLPSTYSVLGSAGSELILRLHQYTLKNYNRLDTLAEAWEQYKYSDEKMKIRDSLNLVAMEIYKEQKEYVKYFIKENKTSLASLIAIYQIFGRHNIIDEEKNIDLLEFLAENLKENYPTNSHANEIYIRTKKIKVKLTEQEKIRKRLEPGNKIPELSLPNVDGQATSIVDYRGKIVLIDFWASWCVPCRRHNPDLVKIYQRYNSRGFEIFGVSLDYDKDMWIKAIEHDKLTWVQVSDIMHWNSPVVKIFNITAIPYNILIDSEGIIIEHNLSIAELNTKLNEILSK